MVEHHLGKLKRWCESWLLSPTPEVGVTDVTAAIKLWAGIGHCPHLPGSLYSLALTTDYNLGPTPLGEYMTHLRLYPKNIIFYVLQRKLKWKVKSQRWISLNLRNVNQNVGYRPSQFLTLQTFLCPSNKPPFISVPVCIYHWVMP